MIQIIPAIDLIDGKCVRLTQGDYAQKKIYNENPLEVAKSFEDAGIQRLHLVDLDGAKQKRIVNHKVLELLATKTNLHIDFGGGVQSDEMIEIAFNSGAKQVTGGSVAVKNPTLFEGWLQSYGGEKIILGADARNEKIAISGWEEATTTSVYDFVGNYIEKGAKYAISTDVAKDGLLEGPSFELYKNLQDQFPSLQIIASGGVSVMDDILKLDEMNIFGVIVGKAIYEGRISLKQIAALHQ
ncbi:MULTISPECIES: 1-(5-phosphoribosyl)-5-[(5-phosphoribosylamino)methylideneamino]imidazole-4-carboxamide isomerase [unclassified Arcicella]|uniref:1-(5-phosphoribosyl)-5-[(5- phosphoribosylamino)methylideneamino]imidazole-4- carboxamide isomerase n=1 Tax=unclassified Arcicella TaxID=2644986 RepID=UPI00285FA720|nr:MULTISPECIES: 1-(5-phosphoribosyl)-5-[(5-phosphoribosylamino)methylideneamino]imidazole-4-carboxamide isomerase [unclassified Arcicella]MDR6564172.1 phosphoribosylformimino-5-aminoimidazole carboxamide ribotide isomerase [Arcicella sp. BE51]MDR6813925.1 phosphoribosylformimino-5-aminoimidazole carboxamide ribotide isomerase [Arcicella sp. BE140]MDR6825237.1 phosphoribosylformimino-5-aminoimidazole carboxamide ribotide isomerase [Arcicella sp. BE139]